MTTTADDEHGDRHPLSRRLPVGHRDRRLPDRGRRAEDGRGASIWDRFSPHARQGARRRHRRRRLRPLPPLPRRRRAHGASSASTPTASRSPGRASSPTARVRSTPPGSTSTRRLVDELLAAGIRPVGHAVPLGPAPGAGGRGRLAGARHRRRASPSTPRSSTTRLGDRVATGPRSTSRGARRSSATPPGTTRRAASDDGGVRSRAAHHLLLGHGLAVPAIRAAAARPRVRHHAQPLPASTRRPTAPRTSPRPARSTASATASSSIPCSGAVPRRRAGVVRADLAASSPSTTATLRRHRRAARLPRDQLLQPPPVAWPTPPTRRPTTALGASRPGSA